MTPTYGLTELGADMIRREYNLGDKGFGNFGVDNGSDGGNGSDNGGSNSGGESDGSGDGGDSAISHLPSSFMSIMAVGALAVSATLFT